MDFKTAIFYFLATVLVIASLRVITARNPVHAVLYLVLAFFSAGSLWLMLEAEFLAIALIMVYVGAVMVLFLFVVMMLDIKLERLQQGLWKHMWVAIPVAGLMFLEMAAVLGSRYLGADLMPTPAPAPLGYSNTKELGRLLFTDYAYPLELASVILLVALVAAVMLTLRRRSDSKVVNPRLQVAVKRDDRLRIVSMPSEKDVPEGKEE